LGIPLRTLIDDYCGGMRGGKKFKGAIPGGVSMGILGPDQYEAALDFAGALAIFTAVAADDSAQKAPDALLKAGFCQYELKRDDEARRTLIRVGQLHPDTPAAAEAARRLERMRAEGR
ncbi:MAG: tetratricopeptide repeat protein, partial [Steroidobacteraceae bacterium]